ncbi:MAG TPA: hypothetical protein VF533_07760 [Solirubrobacteraceae bacterium]
MPDTTADATRNLPAPARAGIAAAGTALGGVFGAVSRLRSGKSLHPEGVVHTAELEVRGGGPPGLLAGVPLLTRPRTYPAIVRFSRSLGLPETAPDFMGLAIRLPDAHGPGAHQDVLLVSSGDHTVTHHLFKPGYGFFDHAYSSVLVFRGRGPAFVVGARLSPGSARDVGHGSEFADLAASAATGDLRYDLGVAPVRGRLSRVGVLTIGERQDDAANDIRFNPWNTGGGLEPTGPINRMREWVYPGSQKGWAA